MIELKEKILQEFQGLLDNQHYDFNITYSDKNVFVNNIISLMHEYINSQNDISKQINLRRNLEGEELEFNEKLVILQSNIPAEIDPKELMITLKSNLTNLLLFLNFRDSIHETNTGSLFITTSATLYDHKNHSMTVTSICAIPPSCDKISKDQATNIAINQARFKAITSLLNTNIKRENS